MEENSELIEQLEYLDETKRLIKQAIINKGQSVNASDTFRSYAQKINNIQTGGSTTDEYLIRIKDLEHLQDNPPINDLSRAVYMPGVEINYNANYDEVETIYAPKKISGANTNITRFEYNNFGNMIVSSSRTKEYWLQYITEEQYEYYKKYPSRVATNWNNSYYKNKLLTADPTLANNPCLVVGSEYDSNGNPTKLVILPGFPMLLSTPEGFYCSWGGTSVAGLPSTITVNNIDYNIDKTAIAESSDYHIDVTLKQYDINTNTFTNINAQLIDLPNFKQYIILSFVIPSSTSTKLFWTTTTGGPSSINTVEWFWGNFTVFGNSYSSSNNIITYGYNYEWEESYILEPGAVKVEGTEEEYSWDPNCIYVVIDQVNESDVTSSSSNLTLYDTTPLAYYKYNPNSFEEDPPETVKSLYVLNNVNKTKVELPKALLREKIGLTSNKIKYGTTILGVTGNYTGEITPEEMQEDIELAQYVLGRSL